MTRRPAALIVGLAIAVLLVGGVSLIAAGRVLPDGTTQAAEPATGSGDRASVPSSDSASSPDRRLRQRLPTADDLIFERARFAEEYSYSSAGPRVTDGRCISPDRIQSLQPADVARRDFSDAVRRARVSAWVLQFDDRQAAERAAKSVRGQIQDCLAEFDRPNGPYVVPDADARYGQVLTTVDDSTGLGTWESLGFVRAGPRVAVLDLTFRDTESHFEHSIDSAEQTGLPLHPMFGTLPEVGQRLQR